MATLANFNSKVDEIIQDDAGKLQSAEIDNFILEAVKTYSKHRPQKKIKEYTGDGTAFDFALPADWEDGFSAIAKVEYPANKRPAEWLEEGDWEIYKLEATPAGKFRMNKYTPTSTEKFRIFYTIRHVVDATSSTVPGADQDAISNLGGSLCCGALSRLYAQVSDSTIGADVVNYRTKSQEYASRAKELMKLYLDFMGIKEGESPAAGVLKDLDVDYPWGWDRLTHPRRWR